MHRVLSTAKGLLRMISLEKKGEKSDYDALWLTQSRSSYIS